MGIVRDAATVMLVRDAPDLQVFMLRRNLDSAWVGGVHLFPGGAVDPDDRSARASARAPGRTDAQASALLGLPRGGLGFWVAAIRESFEEAGVLLARPASLSSLDLPGLDLPGLDLPGLEQARTALNRGERTFLDVLDAHDLILDVEDLHVFSHWITPSGMPRRYDTWFFVANAPDGHAYVHDDSETVASAWVRPGDAIARADAGELEIIFPTRRNLEALARFPSAAELVAHTRQASDVPPSTQPRIVSDGNGARIVLPGDPAYDGAVDLPEGSVSAAELTAVRAAERRARGGG